MKIRMFIGESFHELTVSSNNRGGGIDMSIILKLQSLFQKEYHEFVAEAYRELLDREPDPDGLQQHVNALLAGVPKIAVIVAILQSEEAYRLYHRLP